MSMPGFSAQNSLRRTMTGYHANCIHSLELPRRTVAPQLPVSGGWGLYLLAVAGRQAYGSLRASLLRHVGKVLD
jgi:hypothetical protein